MSFSSLSPLSSQDLIQTFELYDKNKDGFIDENDLSIVLCDLGKDTDPIKIKKMMEAADLDKDGQINLEEFMAHMQSTLEMEETEEVENTAELFNFFKQNQNGHICARDLRSCIEQLGEKLSDTEFEDILKEYDTDSDGFISFEEFCRMIN